MNTFPRSGGIVDVSWPSIRCLAGEQEDGATLLFGHDPDRQPESLLAASVRVGDVQVASTTK
jgi:hypothetical protein